MNPVSRLVSLVRRGPTILRTLSALRPAQARAQIQHMLFGMPAPFRGTGNPPDLAVTTPPTAFIEPAPHIEASEGPDGLRVELLRREIIFPSPLTAFDWSAAPHGPLVAYHLHEQAYLRHAGVSPERRAEIIGDWIARHPEGVGWDPHPISLRLLSWGKLLLTPGALPEDPELRARMARSMRDQAETLSRGLEIRLQANHLLSNLLSVVFAGLLFSGAESASWRARTARLVQEFEAQVNEDGGHEERSPMYHSLLLENVLDLLNVARAASTVDATFVLCLEDVAARMGAALRFYSGPDGRIGLFADSAWGVATSPEGLRRYAEALGIGHGRGTAPSEGVTLLRDSGYARIVSKGFDAIVSTAGPAPVHQPGHAHCDVLSFELFVDGERVVTDSGVFEYQSGENRNAARSTASHATLQFDEREQSELWSAHRVGGRASTEAPQILDDGGLELAVVGWSTGAPRHRRRMRVREDGFEIEDRVASGGHAAISRLPIASGFEAEGIAIGERVVGSLVFGNAETGMRIRIELPDAFEWRLASGAFFPTFHERVERLVLEGHGRTPFEATVRIVRA